VILAAGLLSPNWPVILGMAAAVLGPPLLAVALLRRISLGRRLGGGFLAGFAAVCLNVGLTFAWSGRPSGAAVALVLEGALGYGAWRALHRPGALG
jgi:hypothetical protein